MRALVASIMLIAQLVAVSARADDGDHADALEHLQRGVTAFRAGDYPTALAEFEAARKLAPDKPNPYRWLALTHVQLADCPEALKNIAGFAARVPDSDPRLGELTRLREMCEQTGVVTIDSTPPKVSLSIDGAGVGTTPYRSLAMRAGEHTVTASKPGYASRSQSLAVTPQGEHNLHLQLERDAPGITKRRWFWPAVAGAAAVVIAGVVLVAADGDDGPTILNPVQCDATGCRGASM